MKERLKIARLAAVIMLSFVTVCCRAQNPFVAGVLNEYSGLFTSDQCKVLLYKDAGAVKGKLLSEGKEYALELTLADGTVRGTYSKDAETKPFVMRKEGALFVCDVFDKAIPVIRAAAPVYAGSWGGESLAVTLVGTTPGNFHGVIAFKDQQFMCTGSVDGAGVTGTFTTSEEELSYKLYPGFVDQTINFSSDGFNQLLYNMTERALKEQQEEERLIKEKELAEQKDFDHKTEVYKTDYDQVMRMSKGESFYLSSLGLRLVFVKKGSFMMGSDKYDESDATVRKVTLSRSFWLGEYEISQSQYQSVMGSNPSRFKGDSLPVETVSWTDAVRFCRELSMLEQRAGRLPEGYEYRLPTEAEWEFAARGGTISRGYSYSGSDEVTMVAWCDTNSRDTTHPGGKNRPNELGLFDMSGNVAEWCYDSFAQYSSLPVTDPKGPAMASYRVFRGGSWDRSAEHCRLTSRKGNTPNFAYLGPCSSPVF